MNWIEYGKRLGFSHEEPGDDFSEYGPSFVGEGLYKVGTLVQYQGLTLLIGHVNIRNGGCDCCGGIPPDTIIERYAIVWREQCLK